MKHGILFLHSLISLLSLSLSSISAGAATYYVDVSKGDDRSDGSKSAPWKSISMAADTLRAGDTVIIREGIYRETVTLKHSGSEASRITYKAEPGARVVISGADPVTSEWTRHSGDIYKTKVQMPLGDGNQLFVNGNMMMEAAWPNNPSDAACNAWLLERNSATATEGTEMSPTRYSMLAGAIDFDVPKGSRVFITPMLNHGWANYTCEIVDYDPATKTITFDVPFAPSPENNKVSFNEGEYARQALFFLHGDLSYLDIEKEYFYDPPTGTLYLYQPGGGMPEENSVEYKTRNTGINLNEHSFITIQGITLFACNLISGTIAEGSDPGTLPECSNILIDGINGKYLSHWSTTDVPESAVGIQLSGSYNEIRNSDLSYSMGHGIELNGNNSKIINNRITDCSYLGVYRNNLWISGLEHVVSYNTALRSGRSILGGKFVATKISNNEFAYANYLSSDGACMYLGFWDTGNSVIAYNYVHHPGKPGSWTTGIYFDNYCYNAIIHHNYTEGMQINGPRAGMTIVNNTIFGRGLVWDYWVKDPANTHYMFEDDGAGTYIAYNIIARNAMNLNRTQPIYFSVNWDERKRGEAKLLDDGTLSKESPCIDPDGVVILPYIHRNVLDGKPDLGAFEFGVAPFEYGHDFSKILQAQLSELNFPMMNQLKNPGFEKGLQDWKNHVSIIPDVEAKFRNNKGARIGENSLIYQIVEGLEPGSRYTVAAWSRQAGGIPVLGIRDHGGEDVSITGDVLSTGWTLNQLEITTGPSNTSAVIYLKNEGSGYVDWDQAGVYIQLQDRQIGE